MNDDSLVKILFRFYSGILDEETVETMWAEIIDQEKGYYKLDNIPFYVPKVAWSDIVWAEYDDDEGMLTYRKTIEYSGNSTIHVIIIQKETQINLICKIFDEMGCESERANDKYFAMHVPADINYATIKRKLEELQNQGLLDYSETCLSEMHQ